MNSRICAALALPKPGKAFLTTYSGFIRMVAYPQTGEFYRSKVIQALAATAPRFAFVLSVTDREQVRQLIQTVSAPDSLPINNAIERVKQAMSVTACESLCKF